LAKKRAGMSKRGKRGQKIGSYAAGRLKECSLLWKCQQSKNTRLEGIRRNQRKTGRKVRPYYSFHMKIRENAVRLFVGKEGKSLVSAAVLRSEEGRKTDFKKGKGEVVCSKR